MDLMTQLNCLERHIKGLLEKGVSLLKSRLFELGIKASTSHELLEKAREMVAHNKELQNQELSLQKQINILENQNNKLLNKSQRTELKSSKTPNGFRKNKNNILSELTAMLEQKKQLSSKVSQLENEVTSLEKSQINFISNSLHNDSIADKRSAVIVKHDSKSKNINNSIKLPNYEERINSLIIQALNEENTYPNKDSHRKGVQNLIEENERKLIVNDCDIDLNDNKKCDKESHNSYSISKESNPSDGFSALTNEHNWPKSHSPKKSTEKIHDKKPLLMTLKIDRKDNSASVKECNSPNDSYSKSNDIKHKRKSSDEFHSNKKR